MHVSSQHAAIMNHKNSWLLIFFVYPSPMNLHVQRINETLSLYNYESIKANQ